MTMGTIAFEFGFCGLGLSLRPIVELRLVLLRVWCCEGSIREKLRGYEKSMKWFLDAAQRRGQ